MSEKRFNKLRARWLENYEKQETIRNDSVMKFGQFDQALLLKATQKLYAQYSERMQSISDEFFTLLDKISPRSWRSGVSFYWVMTKLTYANAITRGALSEMPEVAWGNTEANMKRFMQPV